MDSVMIRMLDGFAAGVRKLSDIGIYIGIVTLCVIAVVALYNVVTRLLGVPVSWALEVLELIQIVLAFLPIAYVLNRNAHVRMDLLIQVLDGKRRHILQCIAALLGMCMATLMTYATSESAIASISFGEASTLTSVPVYPFKVCVTIGFALLALQFAGHAWENFRSVLFPATDTKLEDPFLHL